MYNYKKPANINKELITRWEYPNVTYILLSVYLFMLIHRYQLKR